MAGSRLRSPDHFKEQDSTSPRSHNGLIRSSGSPRSPPVVTDKVVRSGMKMSPGKVSELTRTNRIRTSSQFDNDLDLENDELSIAQSPIENNKSPLIDINRNNINQAAESWIPVDSSQARHDPIHEVTQRGLHNSLTVLIL